MIVACWFMGLGPIVLCTDPTGYFFLFRLFVALTGIQYAGGHLRELQRAVKVMTNMSLPLPNTQLLGVLKSNPFRVLAAHSASYWQ